MTSVGCFRAAELLLAGQLPCKKQFSCPSKLGLAGAQVLTAEACWGQVICVDNFFTGSKENIKHLLGKPNFETIRHDVVEKLMLEVDQIYHLACPASPVHYK